ncbi:hypothetical protein [Baaleninema sp.]|uniref:hypothetical protein n=1 Tax=Baaleninema sp. TaxID=3101197 RepID=UPI003D078C97
MTQKIDDPHATRRRYFLNLVQKRVQPGTGSGNAFLNRRTWNYLVTNLNEIIKQAPFVIVGGVATRLYMPERMTLDLDILIKSEDTSLVHGDLEKAGSQKNGELSIPGSQWTLPDGTSLDVLENGDSWAKEAIDRPNYTPDGLPVIALPYLVLMKLLAGRTQDLADISRMLGGATETQLDRVKHIITGYLPSAREDLESLIVLGQLERQ